MRFDHHHGGFISGGDPLTTTDCHKALLSTIDKARLIGVEIARMEKPFFMRISKVIGLRPDHREFDVLLSSTRDQIGCLVDIEGIGGAITTRLQNLLRTLVEEDEDFSDSSGTYLVIPKGYSDSNVP